MKVEILTSLLKTKTRKLSKFKLKCPYEILKMILLIKQNRETLDYFKILLWENPIKIE